MKEYAALFKKGVAMEGALWVIAVSVSLIALVWVGVAVVVARIMSVLHKMREKKEVVTNALEQVGGVRAMGKILQAVVLGVTLWKMVKKRRVP